MSDALLHAMNQLCARRNLAIARKLSLPTVVVPPRDSTNNSHLAGVSPGQLLS
jgi:hypothetical protein